jgi:hypothetical protein
MVGTASEGPVSPPTTALHAANNDEDELGADGADDEGAVVGGSKDVAGPHGLSAEYLSALGAIEVAGGALPAGELPRDALARSVLARARALRRARRRIRSDRGAVSQGLRHESRRA